MRHSELRTAVSPHVLRLALGLAATVAAAAGGVRAGEKPPARPNILYIMADDHAAHAISAYGSKVNQTPHIDRLAKRGHALRPTAS